jgi:hypothetical protein
VYYEWVEELIVRPEIRPAGTIQEGGEFIPG